MHMRHTQNLLCPGSGEVVPTAQAFSTQLPPPPGSLTLLAEQRERLLREALEELARPGEGEGDEEARRVRQRMVEHLQQQLAQRRAQQADQAQRARRRALKRARRARQAAPPASALAADDSAVDTEWRALLRGGG